MDTKDVRIGQLVTWGTGSIRGEVTMPVFNERNPETGANEPFALCALTRAYTTPCGIDIPKGTPVSVPVNELRVLS